tara:strand:- start:528 stop:776 length:249 start_codon:yes stop_codon:yes gene_type:complete
MSAVKSIGGYLFKKHGPENLTLYQLQQAEDEGLFAIDSFNTKFMSEMPAPVICIVEAKARLECMKYMKECMKYRTLEDPEYC